MSFFKYPVYAIPESAVAQTTSTAEVVLTAFVIAGEYGADEKSLLQKIIGATKIDSNQFTIQAYDRSNAEPIHIDDQRKNLILSFGLTPQEFGLQVDDSKYHLINIADLSVLFLDPLPMVKADANLKKALWTNLKNYFNL